MEGIEHREITLARHAEHVVYAMDPQLVGEVGAAATLVPLVDQMNPDASTLAAGGPVDLDISKIDEGQQVVIRWRQRPIFVFRRSKQTLDAMQSKQMLSQLADANSDQLQQPPYATN